MDPTGGSKRRALPAPACRPLRSRTRRRGRVESLGDSPTIEKDGLCYFSVSLPPPGGAHGSRLVVLYPETNWRQARREAATPPLLLGVASLALMAGVTGLIAHRIGRRIGILERRVAGIAAGDLDDRDPGGGDDEVADLARSIRSMCEQLRAMSLTIRRSERSRLLSQVAAGLAHQLRNSLTGARMSIQLHSRRCPHPDDDRSLDVALRQLTMTEEHVKGLLSLGREEARPPAPCDLNRLLRDVAELVHPSSEHARVDLMIRPDAGPLVIDGNEAGLRAALLNLCLNAIEAAGRGGIGPAGERGGGWSRRRPGDRLGRGASTGLRGLAVRAVRDEQAGGSRARPGPGAGRGA